MTSRPIRHLRAIALARPPTGGRGRPPVSGHVLLVDDGSDVARALVPALRRAGHLPIVLRPAPADLPSPEPQAAPTVVVDDRDPAAVEDTVARLRHVAGALRGIVFVHARPFSHVSLADSLLDGLYLAIALARGVSRTKPTPLEFMHFVTAQGGTLGLAPGATADALAPALEALCHPLALELPQTSVRAIDLDPHDGPDRQAECVLRELWEPDHLPSTAYGWRGGERVTLGFQEVVVPAAATSGLDAGTVVVFAGGARGIGGACARELARQIRCHLVFLGRTPVGFLGRTPVGDDARASSDASPEAQQARMDAFLHAFRAHHPEATPRAARDAWREQLQAAEAHATLLAVRALGSDAEYHVVDVRDRFAVGAVLRDAKQRHGRIDAVVHVAGLGGVETDRVLARKDWATIRRLIETKARGAQNLLDAAEETGVPRFIGFGSVASRYGNHGQVDYAAANGLLTGIVRAHNASGALPRAQVIQWGAWDGVGMAAAGPTRTLLAARGVGLIPPDHGAACFVRQLAAGLGSQRSLDVSTDVYVSADWPGLDRLLHVSAPPASSEGPAPAASLDATTPSLSLRPVVTPEPGRSLSAEFWLDPKRNPLLDHHRYRGTAWVPAVLGMEVAVQAAGRLLPDHLAFGLRDVTLKKAVRLIRDEPLLLRADVHVVPRSAGNAAEADRVVHATLTARSQQRSWVFAEMDVLLAARSQRVAGTLERVYPAPPAAASDDEPGEIARYARADLYPSEWLRFQQRGATFQVVDELRVDARARRAEASLLAAPGTPRCAAPATLIDGLLQAYGFTISTLDQHWSGPPLRIGEVLWRPEPASWRGALRCVVWFEERDPVRYPIWHVQDAQGRRILVMRGLAHGGTGVDALRERLSPAIAAPSGSTSYPLGGSAGYEPSASGTARETPYLGTVLEHTAGCRLRAAQVLDPRLDPLLRDHRFNQYALVPAVYYVEVAAEAAARLLPGSCPGELRDFRFHHALSLVRERKTLLTQAEVLGGQGEEGRIRVRFFSRRDERLTLHAEGVVVHGPLLRWDEDTRVTWGARQSVRVCSREQLYPLRFPNGPVFQVVERIELAADHSSRSVLRRREHLPRGTLLPLTLLDGAFQVDSATRSGFDRPSGLPQAFVSLRWRPDVTALDEVVCLSQVGGGSTDTPGRIVFLDGSSRVVLQIEGITLTAAFSSLWNGGAA